MNDWFSVEKIDNQTYVICENKHLEETRCYLLLGSQKAILIDTGLGIANIKAVVDSITELPVMVVTTHVHWDHIGGYSLFDNIAVHELEEPWLDGKFPLPLSVVKANLTRESFDAPRDFDIEKYYVFQGEPQIILHDGDYFDLGERLVKVIHTPGHSPGHCCFYEPDRKYLYSGDLIYKGCLYVNYLSTYPLLFYDSIRKIRKLCIDRVFPGHHTINIPTSIIGDIEEALWQLEQDGRLHHGSGVHSYEDFSIAL